MEIVVVMIVDAIKYLNLYFIYLILIIMKNISGDEFKRDVSGKVKSVTIDLQKHGEALHYFLEKVGAYKEDDFEKKRSEGIKGEELVKRVHSKIRTLSWKKNNLLRKITILPN